MKSNDEGKSVTFSLAGLERTAMRFCFIIFGAAFLAIACTLSGCGKEASVPDKEAESHEYSDVEAHLQYEISVKSTKNGCHAEVKRLSTAHKPMEVTAHLSCKSCMDPGVDVCESTKQECSIMSAHCPEGMKVDTTAAEESGSLQCFSEGGKYPENFGKRITSVCVEGSSFLQGHSRQKRHSHKAILSGSSTGKDARAK
mmetsp:Transcript_127068/g.220158  ORF Transcript_127068/g.220158 Transcript_127068/m.220158 type:complete len:199 (+) Transcript_127068:54-650(+)